jgi:hypothetical protein
MPEIAVRQDTGNAQGFVCEAFALAGAEDIAKFGGWHNYVTGGH